MSHIDEVRSTTSGGTLPFPSNHERLMTELESSEGQLGAIIRSLYDDNEQDDFLVSLQTRIKQHEKDIERMCNKNYQGFIESVTHLVKVKSEAHKLKNKVTEADRVIQESGNELLGHLKDLHTARTIQNNITASIETLTLCIPVLEMYSKLQDHMAERHFYSALKTLEQLEHIYLPRVRGYIFSELLAAEIPRMRESIENQSKSELKEYLAKVRDVSGDIGEVAMHQAQRLAHLQLSSDVRKLLIKLKEDQSPDYIEIVCTQDIVDFSPVYRCLHIHSVLGKRDQFVEEYRSHRRQQLRLAIKPPLKADNIQDFKLYFYQIVGFFVVEDTIMHTCQSISHKGETEGLVSQFVLDEFWDMATSEMLSVLRQHCLHCSNNHLLLKIKQLIVWFCHTIMGYGFKSDKLYEVTLEIREHYDEILMKTYGDAFNNLLASDDYTPVIVETDQQFQGLLELFPYKDLNIQLAPFPKKLPFSSMVIQIFKQIKSYVEACADYSDKLNLSRTEIDEAVRKSVNLLLTKSMSGCLANLIDKGNLTLRQLSQLWVNLDQLEKSEDELDNYIALVTGVPRSDTGSMQSRLYGFSIFKDAKRIAESKILQQLQTQISELMEGVTYDWTPKESIKRPPGVIEDVIRFMNSTFEILTCTPTTVIDNVCIHAIQYLVGLMENILLDERVPRMNMDGLRGFGADVERCEDFVRNTASKMVPSLREGASGLTGGMADSIFARLKQLLTLFEEGAWTDYITELTNVGQKRFPSVPPEAVYNLLTKVLEFERKKKKKFQGMSAIKERLKYYDLILKRLRAQEVKMKTTTSKVASKLKVKKGPNPVKTALRSLHDYLQDRHSLEHTIGSRLAMVDRDRDRSFSLARTSPVLFQRKGTNRSMTSEATSVSSGTSSPVKEEV